MSSQAALYAQSGRTREVIQQTLSSAKNAFMLALGDSTQSTPAKRMARAALMDSFYDECGSLMTFAMFYGSDFRDPHELSKSMLCDVIQKNFDGVLRDSSCECAAQKYKDLKRIIVEAKSMFQQLSSFYGANFVEETVMKVVVSKMAALPNYGSQQLIIASALTGLPLCRQKAKENDDRGAQLARANVRGCIKLAIELLPQGERAKLIPQLLRSRYSDAAAEQLKEELWSVDNVDAFLKAVSDTLDFEYALAAELLPEDPEAAPNIKLLLQKRLLTDRSTDIVENESAGGIAAALKGDISQWDSDRFRLLLNVFDFSPEIVTKIKIAFEKAVRTVEFNHEDITGLSKNYSAIVHFVGKATQSHHRQEFHRLLNTTCMSMVDATLLPVFVADAFDCCFRRQKASSEELQKDLDDLTKIVPLCSNVDLFVAHYKQRLADRLLTSRHPSIALEEYVSRRISAFTSSATVIPVQRMIHEATVRPSAVEGVNTCCDLLWPKTRSKVLINAAHEPFCSKISNAVRVMSSVAPSCWWECDPWLTVGDMSITVEGSTIRVFGVLPQLVVLRYLFEVAEGPQPVANIAAAAGLEAMATFCVILSLDAANLVVMENYRIIGGNASFVIGNNNRKIVLAKVPSRDRMSEKTVTSAAGPGSIPPPTSSLDTGSAPFDALPLTKSQAIDVFNTEKSVGNDMFATKSFTMALRFYERAVEALARIPDDDEIVTLRHAAQSNILLTFIRLGEFSKGLELAKVLLSNTTVPLRKELRCKVLFRQGLAQMELEDFDGAVESLKEAKLASSSWNREIEEAMISAFHRKAEAHSKAKQV